MLAINDQVERLDPFVGPPTYLADLDRWRRSRRHRVMTWFGWGFGLIFGSGLSAYQVATQGYHTLPYQLLFNLTWTPLICSLLCYNQGRPRKGGWPTWSWLVPPQFRMGTLMTLVAYVAILCGLGVGTQKIGDLARLYNLKYVSSESLAKVYRGISQKAEIDAEKKRANIAGLRAGKIPDGLMPGQADFLRELETDPKVTPEHRAYRRGLILDGDVRLEAMQARNAVVVGALADYHDRMAAKYDEARWHPWLPVEPDPPAPAFQ